MGAAQTAQALLGLLLSLTIAFPVAAASNAYGLDFSAANFMVFYGFTLYTSIYATERMFTWWSE